MQADYDSFDDLRKKCKIVALICYKNYLNNLEVNIKNKANKFWNYISSINNTKGYPSSMKLQEVVANNCNDIVELFAEFFKSTYANFDTSPIVEFDLTNFFKANGSIPDQGG